MRKYAKNKKSREYRLLKHRYKILLKSKNNIDNETFKYDKIMECHVTENMILETLLSFDDELRQAYNAKQDCSDLFLKQKSIILIKERNSMQ